MGGDAFRGRECPVIGQLSSVVFDCRDPHGLARFYSELLGLPVIRSAWHGSSEGFSQVAALVWRTRDTRSAR